MKMVLGFISFILEQLLWQILITLILLILELARRQYNRFRSTIQGISHSLWQVWKITLRVSAVLVMQQYNCWLEGKVMKDFFIVFDNYFECGIIFDVFGFTQWDPSRIFPFVLYLHLLPCRYFVVATAVVVGMQQYIAAGWRERLWKIFPLFSARS